jgi:hypothetical protein
MTRNFVQRLKSGGTKKFPALAGVVFFAALARATNVDVQWDNGAGNNDWGNPTNWSGNVLPSTGLGTTGDKIHINLSGTGRAVYSAATGANTYQYIRVGDTNSGELQVTGGSLGSDSTTVTYIGSGGHTGTVTVTNGSIKFGGYMEVGLNSGSTGNLKVSGGLLDSSRNGTIGGVPSVSIGFGDGAGAQGNCVLSGGELRTRTGILLGANGGAGRFEVDGGGAANIGTDNSADDGFWVQSSNSVLAAYVTNGMLGSIYVANLSGPSGTYSDGNVIFMPGSKLEVGFLGATNAGSWDVMKWDGTLLTNGLSLVSGTDTNWSFALVDTDGINGPDTLRLIYIAANLSPPTGIVAVPGNAQVTLRWSASGGATNYFLKRGTSSGGPYTFTNSLAGINYTDTGLTNGVTDYYVVSAAMTNGQTGNSFEVRATPFNSKFVHPGVMHTQADLDRMRTKVVAGEQPWLDGYHKLVADSHSSSSYGMEGPQTTITRDAPTGVRPYSWEDDCGAAYQNALLWYLTGDPTHASLAIKILDAWSITCTNINGSDARLTAGLQGHKFITAAEIIRYTGAPWSQAQINTCSNFIRTVLLPQNKMYGGGNWGIIGDISQMAAGEFMEDEAEFNEAINALKFGSPIECDMGIVNYIDPAGWTTEADRDIGHWSLGLNNDAAGAQIAWCQGVDLWTYLGNRIQVGHEYIAKYNSSNPVSYSPAQQCDGYNNAAITTDGRGRWDIAFYEQAYHPYANLFGIASPFTWLGVTNTRAWLAGPGTVTYPGDNDGIPAEGYDRDHVAFGTLVAALPTRTLGLPVLPSGLVATWSNGVVSLAWSAASGALSYNVERATSRGGPYTNIATGLATTSHTDSTVANNQPFFYKVSAMNGVGETENSGLASAYPSSTAPAAPTTIAAKTISHQRIDVSWNASAGAASYNVKRATAPGGPYMNIAAGVGTTLLSYANTELPAATTFYYFIAPNNTIGTGSDSTAASATTLPALPSPWTFADAGYQTTPGNATYSAGAFTVKGAGLDYGGLYNSDAFGFAYLNLTGDGEIIARYTSRQIYSNIGKTGLAMRESLGDESKHAFVYIGGDTASFVYRSSTGANGSGSGSVAVTNLALPQWLKLNRTGNVFAGSVSTNGTNWTVINSRTITMSNTLLVGFAVCSRNNGYLDTATFDNVSVTGLWPALPGTPADLIAVAGDASAFLNWSTATNATGYNLKRATSSAGPYTTVATNLSDVIFTNTGLVNGTLSYYVVSGTNFFGESTNSNPASVRPVSATPPQIAVTPAGSLLQIVWPSDHLGWTLQSNSVSLTSTDLWFDVPGSNGTNQLNLPLEAGRSNVFFRLSHP